MVTILSAVVSIFAFRFRSRASLELKLIALQHQLAVLRRRRPGRPQPSSLDRLLWVWPYRIWPQVIDAMILVKPATVVQWHRKGFLCIPITSSEAMKVKHDNIGDEGRLEWAVK
jgi:putative transposase